MAGSAPVGNVGSPGAPCSVFTDSAGVGGAMVGSPGAGRGVGGAPDVSVTAELSLAGVPGAVAGADVVGDAGESPCRACASASSASGGKEGSGGAVCADAVGLTVAAAVV